MIYKGFDTTAASSGSSSFPMELDFTPTEPQDDGGTLAPLVV